jgi:hypothetical protein
MARGTTERSFDELASGLARGTLSRGKAIRLMGAALLGGTLASFPGAAWAAKGGKSSCAHFCQSLFGSSTPQEEQCVSQGTKGRGPCFTCTTQTGCGPNFTKPTCTVTGQTYNCSTCRCECPSGQEVCGTSCVSTSCPTGQVFDPSRCTCVAQCSDSICTTDDDCCSSICNSGTCGECRTNGGQCRSDFDCCSEICDGRQCSDCRSDGEGCNFDDDCCNGNCDGGTCASTPTCLPDDPPSRCTTDTQCCGGNCFLGFCTPRNRISCACQNGSIATCTSTDCSDATAVNQLCTDLCRDRVGSPFTGVSTCTPEGCVS